MAFIIVYISFGLLLPFGFAKTLKSYAVVVLPKRGGSWPSSSSFIDERPFLGDLEVGDW